LVVGEVAKGLVHESGYVAHELERPTKSGNEHATFVVGFRDKRDDFARVAILRVLRPERSVFVVLDHQTDEFHEVPDVEHAAAVFDFRECRQFACKPAEQGIVALAALAEYHGRAENHDLERVAVERANAVFGLHFAVAIAVRGVHRSVAGNNLRLANWGAVAIYNGTAHEDKLLDSGFFCSDSAGHGKVCVYGVIEFRTFFANLAVVAVGDSRNVIDGVVTAEIKTFPGVANHVEGIDLVYVSKFGLREVVGKAHADVAVRAGY